MNKSILFVVFDFPPSSSSGVERTLKFARHIFAMGWQPIILTVQESTYQQTVCASDFKQELFPVYRTFCLDVSKHLAYKGKYFGWLKQPDRFWGWMFTAIPKGVQLVKKYDPDLIFSTYPILTSHMVAGCIAKITRKPWIVDYRDPLQCYYDKSVFMSFKFHRWLDRWTIKHCTKAIFATKSAAQMYRTIHHKQQVDKFVTIENGFDSDNLIKKTAIRNENNTKLIMLHAGSLYSMGRNPEVLFRALSNMKEKGDISQENFLLQLRGANNELLYHPQTVAFNISDIVEFLPTISPKASLDKMLSVDVLLVIQGDIFHSQIPGKVYEYFATNKAILAVTPKENETGKLVNKENGCYVVSNVVEIEKAINFLLINNEVINRNIDKYERKHRALELVGLFETIL